MVAGDTTTVVDTTVVDVAADTVVAVAAKLDRVLLR